MKVFILEAFRLWGLALDTISTTYYLVVGPWVLVFICKVGIVAILTS